ncbi:MAG: hypothetical protein ACXW6T_24350, partial [Candidatus Binatia bacterium]
ERQARKFFVLALQRFDFGSEAGHIGHGGSSQIKLRVGSDFIVLPACYLLSFESATLSTRAAPIRIIPAADCLELWQPRIGSSYRARFLTRDRLN